MSEIFNFLVKPSKITESIVYKSNKSKWIIILTLLSLQGFFGSLINYLSIESASNSGYYVAIFFNSIVSMLLFTVIINIVGKIFSGKASFINTLLIIALSTLIISIFKFILLLTFPISTTLFFILILPLAITGIIWFLVILSKSLSKVESFSETIVTFTVIISLVVFFFLSEIFMKITGTSLF